MRVLITGATGFIGSRLVQRLADEHEIYALVRTLPATRHPKVQYIHQDLRLPLDYAQLPRRVDAVIHQAALIDTERVDETIPFLVNVAATWHLLTYAARAGAHTFLYASTGGIYGCRNRPFQESDPPNPMDLYSLTKAQAELAVQSAPGDFQRTRLRYFFPYGLGTPNPIPSYVQRALTGTPIEIAEGGGPRFNPLYVDDAVAATVRALTISGSHTFNIAGTEITTFAEIATVAAQMVGRQPLFHPQPIETMIPYYRADLIASTAYMEQCLGFRPQVSLCEGIQRMVNELQKSAG